jgi:N utilization substance protein B
MQILYALGRDKSLKLDEALLRYRDKVDKSFALYLLNMCYLLKVVSYSFHDAKLKKSMFRPSEEDKKFSAKLAENPLSQSILKNEGFNRLLKYHKMEEKIDEENIRQLYSEFAKLPEYPAYLEKIENTPAEHEEILLELYKFCTANENFNDLIEDEYSQWIDDKSLIVGSIKKTLKALPVAIDFYEVYKPTAETTVDYGEVLLKKVFLEDKELLEVIEPTLKNWDADRVAIIDMILLKMALCELTTFPSIPTKVTLNEFVEIAKTYSTDKSKDFINGILDRLMKQLSNEGKIKKEGRGLQD